MQILVTFTQKEYKEMRRNLLNEIIADSKKGWGVKFISRETGEELEDNAIRGFLIMTVDRILNPE